MMSTRYYSSSSTAFCFCLFLAVLSVGQAFDSSEIRMLEGEYPTSKRSEDIYRFGRSYEELASPLIRFGKRSGSQEASAPLIRFGRAPEASPLIRFGKRSMEEASAPIIRFGRAPEASPLIRFGKRSAGAPLIRFGRSMGAPIVRFGRSPAASSPLIRFGRK